ncbi:MAG: response regulator [Thermoflexales bacterium]|nr:response regulator [Thermoflexales bacterium]
MRELVDPQTLTILIVDDEPANLAIVTDDLARSGFQIKVAQSGEAGLELARQAPPDLVLLDVRLPSLDGFEVCRRLKADERTGEIPVIFMTIVTGVADKLKGFAAGGVDYITKPFQRDELLARVTTHLTLHRLQQDLQDLNRSLEDKVAARTAELVKANRAYRALGECNQAMLHAADEDELLHKVCRIIQQECGYRLVWIGLAEHDEAKTVRPVAQSGYEEGYLEKVKVSWAENERGQGPTGTAIRSGQAVVNRDALANPAYGPWREEALKRGYASSAAVPLVSGGRALGALNVYAAEADSFTPGEVSLLAEIAQDLAYGLESLRVRRERDQVEKALRESQARYRGLFEHSPLPMWEEDFSQVKDYFDTLRAAGIGDVRAYFEHHPEAVTECAGLIKVLDVNQATLALVGAKDKKELLVLPNGFTETSFKAFTEELITLAEGGRYFESEAVYRALGGEEQFIILRLSVAPGYECSLGKVLVSMLDITERRRAEEELQQHRDHLEELVQERTAELALAKERAEAARRSAERANQAKSVFLANMSHELRTPLNAILGYTQILQRQPLPADALRGLSTMRQSGEHLLTLIGDILDLSKIEAGKLELNPADIHLPTFLDTIAGIACGWAAAKKLSFSFETPGAVPTWVKADELRLRQVLLNLLGNACKFTDAGRVTLRVSAQSLSPSPSLSEISICFEIEDTGIGVTAEQMQRLFQPFEQVGDVAGWKEGAGLGLAISRQLVRLMGGDIQVKSPVFSPPSIPPGGGEVRGGTEGGPGSRFWFEIALPVTEAVEELAPAPAERPITGYRGPRRRVLVVDDIPSSRALLVDMLRPLGFELVEAAAGPQALRLAQENRPDLILMDRWMPGMDGFETAQQMRQVAGLQETPIIAVSASVSETDRAQSQAAGIDAFLPKPVEIRQLMALLQEHLHLEWRYEGAPAQAVPLPAEFVAPPQAELAALYELARVGDMRGIRAWAERLAQQDAVYQPFADKLQSLALAFQKKQIVTLVEHYLGGK